MKQSDKKWIRIALILMAAGLVLFTGSMCLLNWDFSRVSTVSYQTSHTRISQPFTAIRIEDPDAEIKILPSEVDTVEIEFYEREKTKHDVKVENQTLFIETLDDRKWFDFVSVSFGSPGITIYLPQEQMDKVLVETNEGDIPVSECSALEADN